jgi:hypothetical protein
MIKGTSMDTIERCERRAKLWQSFVTNYQWQMEHRPDQFSQWCADFRTSFLAA